MNCHINPIRQFTDVQRRDILEYAKTEMDKQKKDIQDEAAARTIIFCVYCAWQTFHIGRDRMPKYLEMLDKFSGKALQDDTWIEETCEALRKIGVDFKIEGEKFGR